MQICMCKNVKSWDNYEVEYGIVNSYLLFRSLMAVEMKEFISLVVLDSALLYCWPEGSAVN